MRVGGGGWEWVGVGGSGWVGVGGWEWVGVGGSGWEWAGEKFSTVRCIRRYKFIL